MVVVNQQQQIEDLKVAKLQNEVERRFDEDQRTIISLANQGFIDKQDAEEYDD